MAHFSFSWHKAKFWCQTTPHPWETMGKIVPDVPAI